MQDFYIKSKQIVDEVLENNVKLTYELKKDGSLVTNVDESIDSKIRDLFLSYNPEDPLIITEESFDDLTQKKFDVKNRDYLILDPIDGTENFNFLNNLFGVTCSARISKKEFHFIYRPKDNLFITMENILDVFKNTESKIIFCSTGSYSKLNGIIKDYRDIRVIGSSATMFSYLLEGRGQAYVYLSNCKIWDCYTGLKLLSQIECFKISIINNEFNSWIKNPQLFTNFKVQKI